MPFLFSLIVTVIILGLLFWLVSMLPIPEPFKQIVTVIIIVICILYVLSLLFGMAPAFPVFRGGRY